MLLPATVDLYFIWRYFLHIFHMFIFYTRWHNVSIFLTMLIQKLGVNHLIDFELNQVFPFSYSFNRFSIHRHLYSAMSPDRRPGGLVIEWLIVDLCASLDRDVEPPTLSARTSSSPCASIDSRPPARLQVDLNLLVPFSHESRQSFRG